MTLRTLTIRRQRFLNFTHADPMETRSLAVLTEHDHEVKIAIAANREVGALLATFSLRSTLRQE